MKVLKSVNSQVDQSDTFEDSDAGTWVTVFGFPPTAASYVLTQTAMWGHIIEHRIPSQVYKLWLHLSLEFVVFLLFHFIQGDAVYWFISSKVNLM